MNAYDYDIGIIGGGAAGMSAALAAAEHGLRVILLESRPWLGGFFDYRPAEYDNSIHLFERARELTELVAQAPTIRVFTHTAVVGAYNNNLITAFQVGADSDSFDERYIEIRAQSAVVATGCIERPLLFENNERPGIMQIGCAHRLARTYGLLPGENVVFSIAHDLGIDDQFLQAEAALKVHHARTGHHVDAGQRAEEGAGGRLQAGLGVDNLGVGHAQVGVGGQAARLHVLANLGVGAVQHHRGHGTHRRGAGAHVEGSR